MEKFLYLGYDGRLYCHLHIATHCNYRCSYCYPKLHVNQQPKWTVDELQVLVDALNSIKRTKQIILCGLGEITLMDGLLDFINQINAEYFSIVTNLSASVDYLMQLPEGMDIDCSFHPQHTSPEAFIEKVVALSEKFVMKPRITLTDQNRDIVSSFISSIPHTDRIQPRVIYDYASSNTAGTLADVKPLFARDGIAETKDTAVRNRDFSGMYCNTNNSTMIVSPDRTVTSCIYGNKGTSIFDFDFSKYDSVRPPVRCDQHACDPCNIKDAKFKNIMDCVAYAPRNFI